MSAKTTLGGLAGVMDSSGAVVHDERWWLLAGSDIRLLSAERVYLKWLRRRNRKRERSNANRSWKSWVLWVSVGGEGARGAVCGENARAPHPDVCSNTSQSTATHTVAARLAVLSPPLDAVNLLSRRPSHGPTPQQPRPALPLHNYHHCLSFRST